MKIIRWMLCGLLAFAVLAFEAKPVWAQSIIEIAVAVLLFAWCALVLSNKEMKVWWSALCWPIAGFVMIGAIQLLLHTTAYPFLTRVELLRSAAYLGLFFLFVQSFRERNDLMFLNWFLIFFCFAVSLLAIAEYFTAGGNFYWSPALATGLDIFGPYTNRNHFAGFVELTLPAGLSLLIFRGTRADVSPLLVVLTIVPISALILSASRGGIFGAAVEIAVLFFCSRKRDSTKTRNLMTVGAAAAIAIGFMAWIGAGQALQRFSSPLSKDVSLARRVVMSKGALHIFRDYPLLGSGLGTTISVYPKYETYYDGRIVDHVHNDYAEMLAETGIIGGLCGLLFLWNFFGAVGKNLTAKQGQFSWALHVGAVAAVIGILVHSCVDYNLHIVANALLFLLQVHIATSVPLPSSSR